LYFFVVAATWRAAPIWWRSCGAGVFLLMTLFCFRGTPGLIAASLLQEAKEGNKTTEASGCSHKASALVVLGGGILTAEVLSAAAQLRIVEAAKIIKTASQEDRTLTVILSGGMDEKIGVPEAQVMKRALFLELGENGRKHEFILEDKSKNTYQNAFYSKNILDKKSIKNGALVLVSSALHMRRSLRTFHRIFKNSPKNDLVLCPVAASSAELRTSGLASFQSGALTVSVLNEYFGMLGYRFKGWN
jgi:uncharacterized SAM-binding protein YcdF (DUF218 family)